MTALCVCRLPSRSNGSSLTQGEAVTALCVCSLPSRSNCSGFAKEEL